MSNPRHNSENCKVRSTLNSDTLNPETQSFSPAERGDMNSGIRDSHTTNHAVTMWSKAPQRALSEATSNAAQLSMQKMIHLS